MGEGCGLRCIFDVGKLIVLEVEKEGLGEVLSGKFLIFIVEFIWK